MLSLLLALALPAEDPFPRASQAIQAAVDAGETAGAVLLVGQSAEVLSERSYGDRVAGEVPMTLDTRFDLASLTKPVATATAVMVLYQRGELELNATVGTYLPGFASNGKEAITVRELLLHRGGLIPDNPLADYLEGKEEAFRRINALAPIHPVGESFVYTDVGYLALARIVEKVSGQPFDEFCEAEIFEPLGMHATGFGADPELSAPTEPGVPPGTVHDPRARGIGGVAGHAGVFSTASDLALWCRAMLGARPDVLTSETLAVMQEPSWLSDGTGGRSLGFDVDTGYSSPRGALFPRGASFGHSGFTGTSLWIDPTTDSYVILLTSRLHPDGEGNVIGLRRQVANEVARVLQAPAIPLTVRTGADVLDREGAKRLAGQRVGLVSNHTGRTMDGRSTAAMLLQHDVNLVALFSPEHGYEGRLEGEVASRIDGQTGLKLHSLYGDTRRPTEEMLAGLDTLVFDIQGAGVRIYTYATTMAYVMEEAGARGLKVLVLDRPVPLGSSRVDGPRADPDRLSFISYAPIPLVHAMTLGELARLFQGEYGVECDLHVVPMEGWRRDMLWEDTGLPWVPPSPNLRNSTQAILYPAIGMLEGTNLSVGRGTDEPFERFGAPWIDGVRLAAELERLELPGLRFTAHSFTPRESKFAGKACGGVQVTLTDPVAFEPTYSGLAIGWVLSRLHSREFEGRLINERLRCHGAWEEWAKAKSAAELRSIGRQDALEFAEQRRPYLLYE